MATAEGSEKAAEVINLRRDNLLFMEYSSENAIPLYSSGRTTVKRTFSHRDIGNRL
jgi:hypothetical protein